jgi:hypothetical protein
MEFRILGPLEALDGDRPLRLAEQSLRSGGGSETGRPSKGWIVSA